MIDTNDHDVIVVGAGAAGLTTAVELGRAGLSVLVVESRDRIGGRILTLRNSANEFPIELGAEFIHGLVPQVWNPLQENQVEISEVAGDAWCWDGQLVPCDFTGDVDRVLDEMDGGAPDQSFAEFLRSCCKGRSGVDERSKRRALSYVVGFNAADPEKVGVHWLAKGMREEHEVMGDRAFRSKNGYEDLLKILGSRLAASHVTVMTKVAVTRIHWKPGRVTVSVEGLEEGTAFMAKKAVVTVPLSILKISSGKEGALEFNPPLPRMKLDALDSLEMGRAFRLVFRFRERFWDSITPLSAQGRTLGDMSFLLTEDEWFPTWWTTMPYREPQITGWAPFQSAERLSGKGSALVTARGLESLSRIMRISVSELEQLLEGAYFHDWQSDPYSCGAYSYGKVGADGAQQALANPLADSLYFAGEATASPGSNGTVHGAIASGYRVAAEILASRL